MSYLLYFGLIAIQISSILATQRVPLKCLLRDNYFLALFDKGDVSTSSYTITTPDPPLLDNLKVDYLKIDQDGLLLEAKDIEFQGLKDMILDDLGYNLNTNISHLTFHSDILVKYLYKVDGSLFFLPIEGEGSCEVFIKNVQVGMVMPFDIIDTNAKKYIELQNYNYWYDVKDNAKLKCANLYYGDKEKSDVMHYLMNQNWKYITIQHGKKFTDQVVGYVFDVFRSYFHAMPLRDFATC